MGRQCLQRGRITYSWTVWTFVAYPVGTIWRVVVAIEHPRPHLASAGSSLCQVAGLTVTYKDIAVPWVTPSTHSSRCFPFPNRQSAGTSYLPDSLLNLPFSTYSTRNVPIRRSFSSPHSLSLSPSFHDHVHVCHVLIPDVVLSSPFFVHCIALSLSYALGDHFGSGAKLGTGQRPCHSWDSGPLVLKPNYPNDVLIPFRLRPDIYMYGGVKKTDAPLPYSRGILVSHIYTNLSQVIRLL
ncbi:hypothetical protein EDD15DRAFT_306306 [Pisolithus albus]|nr:hypothetical protein EDD15DRAFT_306306 [Pisolithus albus]